MSSTSLFSILLLCWLTLHVQARIHHLVLKGDSRQNFKISTFGYLYDGTLRVNVENFSFSPYDKESRFGFTLLKTRNDGLHPFADRDDCILYDQGYGLNRFDDDIGVVTIIFDLKKKKALFRCNPLMKQFSVTKGYINSRRKRDVSIPPSSNPDSVPIADLLNKVGPREVPIPSADKDKHIEDKVPSHLDNPDPNLQESNRVNPPAPDPGVGREGEPESNPEPEPDPEVDNSNANNANDVNDANENYCMNGNTIDLLEKNVSGVISYSFSFHTTMTDVSLIGLYSLYFLNCPNYGRSLMRSHEITFIDLSMVIEEKNFRGYLSAGEEPLPSLYFSLSIVFFILGLVWVQVIRTRKDDAFKIHYLMGALVFVKALALFFHSVDYRIIDQNGAQNETWAILYYTLHFTKGALLFITIALIGTGWAFVKHILSDKDKKIFMIVIPLQVLANVAEIITEESEEGAFMHNIWRTVFLLVDLICCGAILFPIVWSIRHLQEASQTDGKAAINLLKLKLFRRFYVMIVCYIYFTRIIVFILKLVVPFQFEWLDVFFQHAATLLFFISTGYHFQPTHSNPYFQLSQQEDLEMEEVLFNVTPNVYIASSTKKRVKEKENEISEDRQTLITKRENSHDFE
ncbi:protein GPR107 isoform X2 [Tetranychus urticae]|uniref:protein GPR107 isoform X2 n=1 Tax=Tetranychus urticae TaxID=32264 RepID=UPI00077BEA73|nr:protein GPR107 isoform X2 [Tetranychus urticae]